MSRFGEMSNDRAIRKRRRGCHWLRQCSLALLTIATFTARVDGLVTSVTRDPLAAIPAITNEEIVRTALWPFTSPRRRAIYDSGSGPATPHPAVARIVVPEKGATAYGSGTLVDCRDQYGMVVTNWHVVRDSVGVVEVVFPSGFRSQARPVKVDSDWDLAALVIWRPPIEPVKMASQPPRPGDLLTIHGYGQGQYRIATGRCTSFYAPHQNFPLEMVELDVEARQGDSGGPIFNQNGELAGVLFGAGQGTTLGSFGPRVNAFLATLAPDIGQAQDQAEVAVADRPAPDVNTATDEDWLTGKPKYPSSQWSPPVAGSQVAAASGANNDANRNQLTKAATAATDEARAWSDVVGSGWYGPLKSALAVVGLLALALQLVKAVC
jgi:hypothetical protein